MPGRRRLSPILVRPVREQLEHDRIIRLLQDKSRRRFEAGINPGIERNVAVGTGAASVYPDLVLQSTDRSRKLEAIVEVETANRSITSKHSRSGPTSQNCAHRFTCMCRRA